MRLTVEAHYNYQTLLCSKSEKISAVQVAVGVDAALQQRLASVS